MGKIDVEITETECIKCNCGAHLHFERGKIKGVIEVEITKPKEK